MKNFIKNLSIIIPFFFVVCGCYGNVQDKDKDTSTPILPNTILPATSNVTTRYSQSPTVEQEFPRLDCPNPNGNGQILYMIYANEGYQQDYAGHKLVLMDGSGCEKKIIYNDAYGTAEWTRDGTKIAFGCDNSNSICIIDYASISKNCYGGNIEYQNCITEPEKQYKLPSHFINNSYIYGISWFFDGSRLSMEGLPFDDPFKYYTLILTIENGNWNELKSEVYDINWSPNTDLGVSKTLRFIQNDTVYDKFDIYATSPVWSSDGNRIAYLVDTGAETLNSLGIQVMDLITGDTKWILNPTTDKLPSFLSKYFFIGNRYPPYVMKAISWSPDDKYIAFSASNDSEFKFTEIYRIEIDTGKIEQLTSENDQPFAPSWGQSR